MQGAGAGKLAAFEMLGPKGDAADPRGPGPSHKTRKGSAAPPTCRDGEWNQRPAHFSQHVEAPILAGRRAFRDERTSFSRICLFGQIPAGISSRGSRAGRLPHCNLWRGRERQIRRAERGVVNKP